MDKDGSTDCMLDAVRIWNRIQVFLEGYFNIAKLGIPSQFGSGLWDNGIFMKRLLPLCLWTRKSLLKFGSYPDQNTDSRDPVWIRFGWGVRFQSALVRQLIFTLFTCRKLRLSSLECSSVPMIPAMLLSGVFPGAERSGLCNDSVRHHLRHCVRCWSR